MKTRLIAVALPLFLCYSSVQAADGDYDLGLYASIVGADGEPSNDILGFGLFATRQLNDNWFIDLEFILSQEADFERPWKVTGLQQDDSVDTIDAKYSSETLMIHAGKKAPFTASSDWYWSAGIGFNSVDVDDVSGPLQGGGNFALVTQADTETIIGVKLGVIHHLSNQWALHYSLRLDQHLADWSVKDSNSSASGAIANYLTYGLNIGISRGF